MSKPKTYAEAELFDCLERIVELTTRVQAQATIIRDQGGWLAEAKAENAKLEAENANLREALNICGSEARRIYRESVAKNTLLRIEVERITRTEGSAAARDIARAALEVE
jgi:regulator of replication initiation timing